MPAPPWRDSLGREATGASTCSLPPLGREATAASTCSLPPAPSIKAPADDSFDDRLDRWALRLESRIENLDRAQRAWLDQVLAAATMPRQEFAESPAIGPYKKSVSSNQTPGKDASGSFGRGVERPTKVIKQRPLRTGKTRMTNLTNKSFEDVSAGKTSVDTSGGKKQAKDLPNNMPARIIRHPLFDYFMATMIFSNSIFIGLGVEWQAQHLTSKQNEIFPFAERVFFVIFSVELTLRIAAYRLQFFISSECGWNVFDFVLVSMSAAEFLMDVAIGSSGAEMPGPTSNLGKTIRIVRIGRVIRIIRVVRFFAELRLMVAMIANSMRSLFWLLVLLTTMMYVFAICFTQGAVDYLMSSQELGLVEEIAKMYGSLVLSGYTLFQSMCGGLSWGEAADPLLAVNFPFGLLFLVFVFFTIFSVLNIVTGVFVDGAIQRGAEERDLVVQKQKRMREAYVQELEELLLDMDENNDGVISVEEFEECMKDEDISANFTALQIEASETTELFNLLDPDNVGYVGVDEFVDGCLRLKGEAKSKDIHHLMYESKVLLRKVQVLADFMEQEMASVQRMLRANSQQLRTQNAEFAALQTKFVIGGASRAVTTSLAHKERPAGAFITPGDRVVSGVWLDVEQLSEGLASKSGDADAGNYPAAKNGLHAHSSGVEDPMFVEQLRLSSLSSSEASLEAALASRPVPQDAHLSKGAAAPTSVTVVERRVRLTPRSEHSEPWIRPLNPGVEPPAAPPAGAMP